MTPPKWKGMLIHCSATPNGEPFTAEQIDEMHRQRGFKRDITKVDKQDHLKHIGYHFYIELDGRVRAGRGLDEYGAHAVGYNKEFIGICLCGGVDPKNPVKEQRIIGKYTTAQWRSLSSLVRDLRTRYGVYICKGHRDISPDVDGDGEVEPHEWLKTCPGFDVPIWLAYGMTPLPGYILGGYL